jgi:hypothetical protein
VMVIASLNGHIPNLILIKFIAAWPFGIAASLC